MILMLVIPIAFWAREDSKVHDAAKARQAQLELDYSQVLWKLTMLLSAYLTIRGAFSRITDPYEAEIAPKNMELKAHAGPSLVRKNNDPHKNNPAPASKLTPKSKPARENRPIPKSKPAPENKPIPEYKPPSENRKAANAMRHEEMLLTIREMSSGVPEAKRIRKLPDAVAACPCICSSGFPTSPRT